MNPHYASFRAHWINVKKATSKWTNYFSFEKDQLKIFSKFREDNLGYRVSFKIVDNEIIWNKQTYKKIDTKEFIPRKDISTLSDTLYLINSGGYTKIGITNDTERRLSELQTANPMEVTLIYSAKVHDPIKLERYLHYEYNEYNTKMEWFNITKRQINAIQKYIERTVINENWTGETIMTAEYESNVLSPSETLVDGTRAKSKYINKPQVKTITDEKLAEYINDRSAQIKASTKHGMNRTTGYKAWQAMKAKARNKGFTVCSEWVNDPKRFWDDVKPLYTEIDRPAMVIKDGYTEYNIESISVVPLSVASAMTNRTKRVVRLTIEGWYIATYDSAHAAERECEEVCKTKAIAEKINAVCNKKRSTHAFSKWEYYEEGKIYDTIADNWLEVEAFIETRRECDRQEGKKKLRTRKSIYDSRDIIGDGYIDLPIIDNENNSFVDALSEMIKCRNA